MLRIADITHEVGSDRMRIFGRLDFCVVSLQWTTR